MTLNNNASIINEEMIYNLINASREFVRTKNISECKNFIQSYVEKVIVYNERVEVLFKIHVPSDDGEVEPLMSGEKIKVLQRQYR
jgi:site-specific DNA recombinase